ncbi:MAG: PQQ-binding-like beta-propeller repeat protein [Planctomycetota bacterium]
MTESREGILEFPCDVERLANGNTLITDAGDELGRGSEILEVTPRGELAWRYAGTGEVPLRFAHSAKRLENGNTLIADTTNDRVIEVTPDGEIVWNTDDLGDGSGALDDGSHLCYPNKAKLLGDGTILISDRNNDRALIVRRNGQVAWQYAGQVQHPHNPTLLANGNLVICDSDGQTIKEVDRDGNVVWSYGDGTTDVLFWPRDADRLVGGNTLITDSKHHRIIEVTPDGQIVWEYAVDYWANFYDADRLPNRNTLIAGQQHQEVLEVDPDGEIVWQFRNYTRPTPINEKILNATFEEWDDGTPSHWHVCRRLSEGGGEFVTTTNAAGKKCPGLRYDRDGGLWLQQTRAVEPGKTYRVSGLVSTEGLDGFACLQIAFVDEKGGMFGDAADNPRSDLFSGDTPWSREIFSATAPDRAVAADLRLFLTGIGEAYVDEFFCFG